MYSLRMVRQSLRLALLVTLVVLAISACGEGATQEQANNPRHLPQNNATLRPGEYHSQEFEPSLSFRIGKGWDYVAPELSDKLAISQGGAGGDPLLIFSNLQQVFKPAKGMDAPPAVEAPKDMVAWFQHHPYLKTDKPEPISVGGVKGEQFDWIVAEDAPYAQVETFKYSDGSSAGAGKGFQYRAIVLENVKGEQVTIGIGSPAGEFEEFAPEAQKVLETVKWGDS